MADTQAMPALARALTGVLPDSALRQLMQALGNCNQPFTSRAPQNFQPNEQLGNSKGVYGGGRWNPSSYQNLLPPAGSNGYYELPGPGGWQGGSYYGGGVQNNNYAGNNFSLPTNQEFNLNNYYGGPTFNVAGNTEFNNITANNVTTNQITVTGGGGGGGWPDQPPAAAAPGDVDAGGGFAGDGGFAGGNMLLILNGGGNAGRRVVGRQINLRASGKVNVPSEGTLTDDCKVQLSGTRRVDVTVEISPMNFMALG